MTVVIHRAWLAGPSWQPGRSLRHLIETVRLIEDPGAGIRALSGAIDKTAEGGRLFSDVFGALAECERNLIRERTYAGLAAARARERLGGRPSVMTPTKVAIAREMSTVASTPSP
jgi:DNA invertase Pin-like site-specific DNA recombinase